jgi:hypothetical protein
VVPRVLRAVPPVLRAVPRVLLVLRVVLQELQGAPQVLPAPRAAQQVLPVPQAGLLALPAPRAALPVPQEVLAPAARAAAAPPKSGHFTDFKQQGCLTHHIFTGSKAALLFNARSSQKMTAFPRAKAGVFGCQAGA